MDQRPLVYEHGLLGFRGFDPDGLFCVIANGDNHFLLHGIAEGSLLVVDRKKVYQKDKLNVFWTDVVVDGERQLKLSLTKIKGVPYAGRVVMSVNQYS